MIPCFYINLQNATNRNTLMLNSLTNLNIQNYRIDAINSSSLSHSNKTNKNALESGFIDNMHFKINQNIKYKPRPKEIAIILSHIKTLNSIIDNNIDIAVVLEDDISLQYITNWNDTINDIINNAPKDWKIIKLHTSMHNEITNNISLYHKNILFTPLNKHSLSSAGCYIIKLSTAKEIINKYKKNNIYTFPNDNEFCVCECIIFSCDNIYLYTKPIICVNENNINSSGCLNPLDLNSNKVIHKFWNPNYKFIIKKYITHNLPSRKILSLKQKILNK